MPWWKLESQDKQWRKKAAPYLEPGESLDAVIGAARARAIDMLVVATNRRILLLKVKFSGAIDSVIQELPRSTRLGPPKGTVRYYPPVLGGSEFVNRVFWDEIRRADAALDEQAPRTP